MEAPLSNEDRTTAIGLAWHAYGYLHVVMGVESNASTQ